MEPRDGVRPRALIWFLAVALPLTASRPIGTAQLHVLHSGHHLDHGHHDLTDGATGTLTHQGALKREAVPFDLGVVRLAPGSRWDTMQLRNLDFMVTLDNARLLCLHTSAANLTGNFTHPTCEPYGHPQYFGHYLGHWLSATAMAFASTNSDVVRDKSAHIVTALARVQSAWTTAGHPGYLFPYDPTVFDSLEEGLNCKPVCVPFYVMHKMMAGLMDQYTLAGNEEAYVMVKDMATWVQQYVESILERRGQSQWQIALNTEWGGMNEALFNLLGLTGDPNHLVTANYFNHFSWTAPLAINVDDLAGQHANTHIPEIVGAARGYELTQNVTQRDITVNFWNILNSTRTYATGGSSDNEHWGPPHRLGDELNANTEESCTTYNILKVARHLYEWTANSTFMDFYERALLNGLLGNQNLQAPFDEASHTTGFIYMLPLGGGGVRKGWGKSDSGFPCCWGTLSETFAKLGDSVFFRNADNSALYVNLFVSSTVHWGERGVVVSQDSAFPESTSSTTRITITRSESAAFSQQAQQEWSLYIRVPFWADSPGNLVHLNGQAWTQTVAVAGSYLEIRRAWADGDWVEVFYPMSIRFEQINDERAGFENTGAVMYGPVLLAGLSNSVNLPLRKQKLSQAVRRNSTKQLSFEVNDECGHTVHMVPLMDVMFEQYTVYFTVGGSTFDPAVAAPPSMQTTIAGTPTSFVLADGASVVYNAAAQNIRSGDPGQTSQAAVSPSFEDAHNIVTRVAFAFQYVNGYGLTLTLNSTDPKSLASDWRKAAQLASVMDTVIIPAQERDVLGEPMATNFSLVWETAPLKDDPCAKPTRAVLYSSPPLNGYPYDVCNTCYSPLTEVDIPGLSLDTSSPSRLVFEFRNNDRNAQLLLPLQIRVWWNQKGDNVA